MSKKEEMKMLREDIDSITRLIDSMSRMILRHDDTITRLTLELARLGVCPPFEGSVDSCKIKGDKE